MPVDSPMMMSVVGVSLLSPGLFTRHWTSYRSEYLDNVVEYHPIFRELVSSTQAYCRLGWNFIGWCEERSQSFGSPRGLFCGLLHTDTASHVFALLISHPSHPPSPLSIFQAVPSLRGLSHHVWNLKQSYPGIIHLARLTQNSVVSYFEGCTMWRPIKPRRARFPFNYLHSPRSKNMLWISTDQAFQVCLILQSNRRD